VLLVRFDRELLIPKTSHRSESGFTGYVCISLLTHFITDAICIVCVARVFSRRELLIPKTSHRSESGFKGVHKSGAGRYQTQVYHEGNLYHAVRRDANITTRGSIYVYVYLSMYIYTYISG